MNNDDPRQGLYYRASKRCFMYFLFPMTDAVICKMLNLGTNWSEVHWPDNWTATTVDGKRSAQFEETLLYVTV